MFRTNRINFVTTLLVVFAACSVFSSKETFASDAFGVKVGGFIRTDMYWDSRMTTGPRESMLLFFPRNEQLNEAGKDINAIPNFNWGAMGSRLSASITAPDFLGAKVTGLTEVEFIGQADAQTNVLRMRHAWVNLDWGKSKLLVGQFWHPMFRAETMPLCVSLNVGASVGPLARNPQVRFTQALSETFSVQATAFTERDFLSVGPDGGSTVYQKHALVPSANLTLMHRATDGNFIVGAGAGLKTIKPYNVHNVRTAERVDGLLSSFAANLFMGCAVGDFTFRLNGFYGGNMSDMMLPGGYAVLKSTDIDKIREMEYTPFNTLAATLDVGYSVHKNLKIGISGGMNMNLGTADEFAVANSTFTTWGSHINQMMRVAPRATYQAGRVQFGAEVEFTQAAFGKDREYINETKTTWQGKWAETTNVSNLRFLLATTLFF